MSNLLIGLDVGYSQKKRTCGVAVNAEVLPSYGGSMIAVTKHDGTRLFAKRMRLGEAKNWLTQLKADHLLHDAIVVLDGMLGPNGPPARERTVDCACMTGRFVNRAVAASVVGGGQRLVQATYELTFAATGCLLGSCYRFSSAWVGGSDAVALYETNPVVGLAAIMPMVEDVRQIPSRSSAPVAIKGNLVKTKSDYYWMLGGGQRVAEVLGAAAIADEKDHELRAGFFCLGVAVQLAGEASDKSRPICVGDPMTGTYILLGPTHSDWESEMLRIGIVAA